MRVASRWNQRRERHVSCRSVPFVRVYPGEPWYQKGKTNLDFTEARDSEWQWHQLGHMQVCTSLQTDSHTSTLPLSFLQAGCLSCRPTDSVKALKAKSLKAVYTKCSYKTLSWTVKLFSTRTYVQTYTSSWLRWPAAVWYQREYATHQAVHLHSRPGAAS